MDCDGCPFSDDLNAPHPAPPTPSIPSIICLPAAASMHSVDSSQSPVLFHHALDHPQPSTEATMSPEVQPVDTVQHLSPWESLQAQSDSAAAASAAAPASATWQDAASMQPDTHGQLPRLPRDLSFLSIDDVDLDVVDNIADVPPRCRGVRDQDLRRTALINRSSTQFMSPRATAHSHSPSHLSSPHAALHSPRPCTPDPIASAPLAGFVGSGLRSPVTPRGAAVVGSVSSAASSPAYFAAATTYGPHGASPLSPQRSSQLNPSQVNPSQGSTRPARMAARPAPHGWPERAELTQVWVAQHFRGFMPQRMRELADLAVQEGWTLSGSVGSNGSGWGSGGSTGEAVAVPATAATAVVATAGDGHGSRGSVRLTPGVHCYGQSSPGSQHSSRVESPDVAHPRDQRAPSTAVAAAAVRPQGSSLGCSKQLAGVRVYSPDVVLGGRPAQPHVKGLMLNEGFVAALLCSLPGVDAHNKLVASTITALGGGDVVINV
eukprot:jgi/Chrzof1/7706/Cz02g33190.t1